MSVPPSVAPTGPRAVPFYCPYCGEEDFVPSGEEHGRYHCRSCDRHFVVRFLGLGSSARSEPTKGA